MATVTQHIAYQSPSETISQCLLELQKTYVLLLETDESEAYQDVGLTLRCYAESLSVMNNLFSTDDEEAEDASDDE